MAPDFSPLRPSRRVAVRRLAHVLGLGLSLLVAGSGFLGGPGGPLRLLGPGAAVAAGNPGASPDPSASPSPSAEPTPTPTPVPTPTPTPAPTPVPAAALQAQLNALRLQYHVPGVSVTIIWPDGRSWLGVAGWADVKRHVPVVRGTAFSVGSISKTFLAALIIQLADEGRLSLDDPVLRWLPSARVRPDVTIRELLDHTSGVYDFFSNPNIDRAILADKLRVWTPADALHYQRTPPYCPAGTCWTYSNSNYVLLGQIVRQVTGSPAATELRRRFFDPLNLTRTFVQGAEARRGTVATSYQLVGPFSSIRTVTQSDGTTISPFTSVVTAAGDAGAIAASSRDLAMWARRLYRGAVLPPDALASMLDVSRSVGVGSAIPYGLGVEEIWLGGRRTVGHNGRLIGAGASMRYLPDSGFSIAVVTNQDRVGPDFFTEALLDIVLPPPPPIPAPAPTPTFSPLPSLSPSFTPPPGPAAP